MIVAKDLPFVRLARRNVHDSDFVRVDDRHSIKRAEKGGEACRVHHLASLLADITPVL